MMGELPFRLAAVTLEAFRGWPGRHRFTMEPGLTLIRGSNGAGKSSLLNAIEWCFFGSSVARRSSGLVERGEWEVANRDANRAGGDRFVEVALELETPGLDPELDSDSTGTPSLPGFSSASMTLTRRRPLAPKSREPDTLELELPSGQVLAGDAVHEWLEAQNFPDWTTWKHAFCQHQELPRSRVVVSADRSVQLGRLLGLEDYRSTSESLKALRYADLATCATAELERVEEDLRRELEGPGRELRDLEERLERRGLARSVLAEDLLAERVASLASEGRRVATELDLERDLPEKSDTSAVLRWAQDWPADLHRQRRVLEEQRTELSLDLRALDAALEGMEPARRRLRDAESAREQWLVEHGGADVIQRQQDALREELDRLRAAQRAADARGQLVAQALEFLEDAHGDAHEDAGCPVCGDATEGLLDRVRERAARAQEGSGAEFDAKVRDVRARLARLEEQSTQGAALESDVDLARIALARLERQLDERLPGGVGRHELGSEGLDELRARWSTGVSRRATQLASIDEHLLRHRSEVEVAELLSRWQAARARADAAEGNLDQIEAWNELQAAIDEASALATDLDALAGMAREVQEERSQARVREVNRSLGKYYGMITQRSEDQNVSVAVRATSTKLNYQLVDREGRNILPVLNQAALNAVSIALLFAQAEQRFQRGFPQWIQLDDPGQSLDDRGVEGLVRAILELPNDMQVLVATFPGALAEALARCGGTRRLYDLAADAHVHARDFEEARP